MDAISPTTLGLASLAAYLIGSWSYNIFFHPLRHIPGPWYAAMSPMWLKFKDIQFKKALAIEELFVKYGDVVRIEPNVVAFVDPAAMRLVYSATSRFPKSSFYKALLTNENDHAMTTLDPVPHAPKKRAYAPHYTPNNLSLYQPEMHEYTQILLQKMDEYDGKRSFDCLVLFRRLLVDVIFISSYGQRINSLKQWNTDTFEEDPASEIVRSINLFPIRGVFRASFPKAVWDVIIKIPIKAWKAVVDSDRRVAEYVLKARDIVLASDSRLDLHSEIDPLMPDDGHGGNRKVPDFQVLNRLPYLTGFVKETLRVYGSAPSLLERVVPDSLNGEWAIQGHKIPTGAIVGTQAWSMHRRKDIFPDPYAFKPERWLDETEEMRAAFMPFGTGGRICGGMNLAQYMLRIALVATIRNFDPVTPPETTEESMATRFAFVLLPAAQKANIIFVPRKM
ncbi:hypothetical protein FRB99_000238 [Tulasnella sp. 403]|nr:hypothetical protein FRB99_000238 [Tulasnella sp. 403]